MDELLPKQERTKTSGLRNGSSLPTHPKIHNEPAHNRDNAARDGVGVLPVLQMLSAAKSLSSESGRLESEVEKDR